MSVAGSPRPLVAPVRSAGIKEVAARAGVAWSTVSSVVHGRAHVRPETRRRVQEAIDELGYRPSMAGRELRRGRADAFTLAIPDITSPYFSGLAQRVIAEARKSGHTVLIDEVGGDHSRELEVAGGYTRLLTDGVIFSPLSVTLDDLRREHIGTPLVLLGEWIVTDEFDLISIDNTASAIEATNHLISLGRHRIAFLGNVLASASSGTGARRIEGYRIALADAGIEFDDSLVLDVEDFTRERGEARVRAFVEASGTLDGLVCANDLLAIGAMGYFRHSGINVPEDVSVIGWDDIPDGAYTAPTLTTIAPDMQAIARKAIDALLRQLADPATPRSHQVVGHRLVVRQSTATAQ